MADAVQGEITITTDAIAQLAGLTAAECYGVVGAHRRAAGWAVSCLGTSPSRASRSCAPRMACAITLRVVVEHGLNLAEVASTVRSHVGYEVSRLTGIPTTSVDVLIADVRTST